MTTLQMPYIDRFFNANLKVFSFGPPAFKEHMRNKIPTTLLENSVTSRVVPVGNVSLNNASHLLYH